MEKYDGSRSVDPAPMRALDAPPPPHPNGQNQIIASAVSASPARSVAATSLLVQTPVASFCCAAASSSTSPPAPPPPSAATVALGGDRRAAARGGRGAAGSPPGWRRGDDSGRREWRGAGMRTICDVCESAPAVLFCAADEAALCRSCDEKVHMCNKLASRHVRVGLANSNKLTRCDICESFPAFFHCEIDGTSLCLSCDMTVHVGGKRTHGRYLLLRQSVEFPGDKLGHMDDVAMQSKDPENQIDQKKPPHPVTKEQMANHHNGSDDPASDDQGNINSKMIDLNMRPVRTNGQGSNSQTQGVDLSVNNHDSPGVVPTSNNYEGDANK